MLKKNGSKFMSIVLVMVLVALMVTGCKSDKTDTNKGSTTEGTETTKNTDKGTEQGSEVTELDVFINFTWYTNEQFEGLIPEEITKRTGVKLNVTKAADDKQLGLMIASGTLPDIIFTSKELSRLSDPNVSYSYNELIKNYIPAFSPDAERIMNAKSFSNDDNYYTILSAYGSKEEWSSSKQALLTGPGLIFRRDIYEALGSPALNTPEDFKALLLQVKSSYPDMKPFVFNPIWKLTPFKVAYGVESDGRYSYYRDNNGNIEFGYKDDNYLDYLKFMNELYRDGLITADNFAIKNESNVNGDFEGGKAFAITWVDAAANNSQVKIVKNVPDAKVGLVTGLKTNNQPVLSQNSIGWAGVFVSKNAKNPEKAAELIEFLYSQEGRELTVFGREGIDWNRQEDGTIKFTDEMLDIRVNDTQRWESEWNKGFYFGKQLEENIAGGVIYEAADNDLAKEIVASSNYNKTIVDVNPKLRLILPKADTKEKVTYDKLTKLIDDYEAKMILAENADELMATYDEFVKIASKMGAEGLEKTLTDAYQALK